MGSGPSHAEKAQQFVINRFRESLAASERQEQAIAAAPTPREDWWPLNLDRNGLLRRGMHAGQKPIGMVTLDGARFLDFWPGAEPKDFKCITKVNVAGPLIVAIAEVAEGEQLLLVWSFDEGRCLWVRAIPPRHKVTHLVLKDGKLSVHTQGQIYYHCQVFDAHTGVHLNNFEWMHNYWTIYPSGRIVVIDGRHLTIRHNDGESLCEVELPESVQQPYKPALVRGNEFLQLSEDVFVAVASGEVYDKLPPSTGPCPSTVYFHSRCDVVSVEVGTQCSGTLCNCGAGRKTVRTYLKGSGIYWMPDPLWLARGECADIARAVRCIDAMPEPAPAEPAAVGLVRAVLVGFLAEDARVTASILEL